MVNKLFNGKINVDFGSTWKDKADNRNTPLQDEKPVEPTKQEQQAPQEQQEQEQEQEQQEKQEQEQEQQKEDDNKWFMKI